jgi:hypothetical protein
MSSNNPNKTPLGGSRNGNVSDNSEDEDAFLQSLGLKQKLKQGKELAAKNAASSSGKGKDKAAIAGGSFQSMGGLWFSLLKCKFKLT